MIGSAAELDPAWLAGKTRIGVTAGASAPERLVQDLLRRLKELGVGSIETLAGVRESMTFPLPKGLARPKTEDRAANRSANLPGTPD